ncbi:ankyrin repeat-containing domain protein, partial [Paraphysoderma sedebokerense]
GQTFLHRLCSKGDLEMVTELVTRRRIPVNPKDNAGWTPLHEAALEGHTEIARILILRGATVNSKGFRNDTPLHDASSNGHYDLVKLLLDFGADPNATNDQGQT